jgi:hypothetical protein
MTTEGKGLYAGIAAFALAVFFIEILMPLGFTPWLLYVIPLGLTYWASYLYAPIVVATACTILLFVGHLLSPEGVSTPIALTNRAFGVVTFWILGVLILQYKLLGTRLSNLTKTLAIEVTERTRDLGRAVSALQKEVERGMGAERDPSVVRAEFERQVTNVLTAEGRRLQEKIARCESVALSEQEEEAGLEATRNELMELGHRLERLQRELLQDGDRKESA